MGMGSDSGRIQLRSTVSIEKKSSCIKKTESSKDGFDTTVCVAVKYSQLLQIVPFVKSSVLRGDSDYFWTVWKLVLFVDNNRTWKTLLHCYFKVVYQKISLKIFL